MPDKNYLDGDSLILLDDDMYVCAECGSPEVQSLVFVGLNDHVVDWESGDYNNEDRNWCLDCGGHCKIITRGAFLQKMNDWFLSLTDERLASVCERQPFARVWNSCIYDEKQQIYNDCKDM